MRGKSYNDHDVLAEKLTQEAGDVDTIPRTMEVLVCTHNRVELLERAIFHLNQAIRPDDFAVTIFVVANACSDDTAEFLSRYTERGADATRLPLKWIEESKPGKSNALNTAISMLTAPVIAMVDDDHRVDTDFFVAIHRTLAEFPDADFYCGRILPDWAGDEPPWVHDDGKYKIYPLPVPQFDLGDTPMQVTSDIAHPGGGNLVVKTRLFSSVGLFSNDYGPVGHNLEGAEDMHWVIRAYQLGAQLQYSPTIIQYHYVDTDRLKIRYVIKKAYARSCSTVRLNRKTKDYFLFPRYLIRKSIKYLAYSVFTLSGTARRFYLVRLAAVLGEIKGFILLKRDKASADDR